MERLITFTELRKKYHFPRKIAEIIPVNKSYENLYGNTVRLYEPAIVEEWSSRYALDIESAKIKSAKASAAAENLLNKRIDNLLGELKINLPGKPEALLSRCKKLHSQHMLETGRFESDFYEDSFLNAIRHNFTNYDVLWEGMNTMYRHNDLRERVNNHLESTIIAKYGKTLGEIYEMTI